MQATDTEKNLTVIHSINHIKDQVIQTKMSPQYSIWEVHANFYFSLDVILTAPSNILSTCNSFVNISITQSPVLSYFECHNGHVRQKQLYCSILIIFRTFHFITLHIFNVASNFTKLRGPWLRRCWSVRCEEMWNRKIMWRWWKVRNDGADLTLLADHSRREVQCQQRPVYVNNHVGVFWRCLSMKILTDLSSPFT